MSSAPIAVSNNADFKIMGQDITVIVSEPGFNLGGYGSGGNHASAIGSRFSEGTCWSASCHEDVHGSNVNASLRP